MCVVCDVAETQAHITPTYVIVIILIIVFKSRWNSYSTRILFRVDGKPKTLIVYFTVILS